MLRVADQAEGIRLAQVERAEGDGFFRIRRTESAGTKTYAITSGKGGVGKTQVSANLAVAMARQGKKVLLLDADLGLASLDLTLGLKPKADLLAVIHGDKSMDDILIEGPCGVQLLPACPGRYEMANLGPRERTILSNAVDQIARRFDVLVIDTGAGIGSTSVSFAASADEILLVTTPDPTALRDAYAVSKVLHLRCGVERVQLLANQVSSERDGAELHDKLQQIVKRFLNLDLRYLGAIPRDDSVRQAVAAGEPFVLRAPNSAASRAAWTIVQRLTADPTQRRVS